MMLFCSSRIPPADVYLVRPAFIAAAAACLMFSGVSKSGSPAPKSQTFTPAARNASAACMAAIAADDCIRPTFSETENCDVAGFDIAGRGFILEQSFPSFVFRRAAARGLLPCHPTETLLLQAVS